MNSKWLAFEKLCVQSFQIFGIHALESQAPAPVMCSVSVLKARLKRSIKDANDSTANHDRQRIKHECIGLLTLMQNEPKTKVKH